MLTTNDTKKALIAKLLEDKHITLDDAFMLLDEVEKPQGLGTPTVWPLTVGPLGYWWYDSLGHAHWVPAGQLPPITVSTPVITWGTSGTITAIDTGAAITTSIVSSYPPGTVMSYTAN